MTYFTVVASTGHDTVNFDYYGGFRNLPHDMQNFLAWKIYSWPHVTGIPFRIDLTGEATIGE